MLARSASLEGRMPVLQDAPANRGARLIPRIRLAGLREIIPPATVWLIITAPVWAALVAPAAFGFGMILFSVYWLWKSLSFASGVLVGFWRLHKAQQRDWVAAARVLPGYDQLRHLVIVPTCGENEEILADTLHCLTLHHRPLDPVTLVL